MMTFSQYYTSEGGKIPVGSNQFAALSDDFVMAANVKKVKKVQEVQEVQEEKVKEKKVKRDKGQK